jgi:GAF domain-containing protein
MANDAVHALNMAREHRPDAIIVGARLAGGAVVASQRLRSNVYTTHIPIIGVAPRGIQAKQMTAAGARECIAPPIDLDELLAAVARHKPDDLDFTEAPKEALADKQRMADLKDTGLLDSPRDESFDRLTRLATKLLRTPTALMTLVDKDRQFFKSDVGLAAPWSGARQTRLSHSFCQWVVAGNEALVVEDAKAHRNLKSNLAIRDLGVIAYAGVPVAGRAGQPIGSLCAIDSKPRAWSASDLETLEDLGRIARGYAILDQAQVQRKGRSAPRAADIEVSAMVGGHAALGATRILRRHPELDARTRDDLLAIIEEHAAHLAGA